MLGILKEEEIEKLLKEQYIGRLACHAHGVSYIVPINYVYNNGTVYAHSAPGQKIRMMKSNPQVCFQTDQIRDTFNWKSVVCWGKFEEINDNAEKQRALQGIIHRMMPLTNTPSAQPSHGTGKADTYDEDIIVFKIILHLKTGRFEVHDTVE
ncbi:pyridoxamine 5'-phosphate oxidase [Sphingobacteriaceae bacterium GW460-11-11-14-LB5]|nr:pyridoxamine 5'-phosphate oxidase [Sphingobacteriaceae bacterium GW460-11-11-14-LB5]